MRLQTASASLALLMELGDSAILPALQIAFEREHTIPRASFSLPHW